MRRSTNHVTSRTHLLLLAAEPSAAASDNTATCACSASATALLMVACMLLLSWLALLRPADAARPESCTK